MFVPSSSWRNKTHIHFVFVKLVQSFRFLSSSELCLRETKINVHKMDFPWSFSQLIIIPRISSHVRIFLATSFPQPLVNILLSFDILYHWMTAKGQNKSRIKWLFLYPSFTMYVLLYIFFFILHFFLCSLVSEHGFRKWSIKAEPNSIAGGMPSSDSSFLPSTPHLQKQQQQHYC